MTPAQLASVLSQTPINLKIVSSKEYLGARICMHQTVAYSTSMRQDVLHRVGKSRAMLSTLLANGFKTDMDPLPGRHIIISILIPTMTYGLTGVLLSKDDVECLRNVLIEATEALLGTTSRPPPGWWTLLDMGIPDPVDVIQANDACELIKAHKGLASTLQTKLLPLDTQLVSSTISFLTSIGLSMRAVASRHRSMRHKVISAAARRKRCRDANGLRGKMLRDMLPVLHRVPLHPNDQRALHKARAELAFPLAHPPVCSLCNNGKLVSIYHTVIDCNASVLVSARVSAASAIPIRTGLVDVHQWDSSMLAAALNGTLSKSPRVSGILVKAVLDILAAAGPTHPISTLALL